MAITEILTFSTGTKCVVGPTGTLDTIAANAPAYDYSTGRRRLLIEAAGATNLCAYGRSPALTGWTCRGVTPTGGIDDAVGGTNAVRVTVGSAGSQDIYNVATIGTAGERCEPSIYIRKVTASGTLRIDGVTAATGAWSVDLGQLGSGWERITRDHPAVTIPYEFISGSGGAAGLRGVHIYASSGALTVDLFGHQLEIGEASTSLIITNGAAVTRIPDDVRLSAAALAQVTGAGGCTIAVRGSVPGYKASGYDILIGGNATASTLTSAYLLGGVPGVYVAADGVVSLGGAASIDVGVALTTSPSGVRAASKGGAIATRAHPLFDAGTTAARLGGYIAGGADNTSQFYLDEIVIWPFVGSAGGLQAQARAWS